MVRALVGDSTITSVDIVLDVLDQQLETNLSEMGFRARQAVNMLQCVAAINLLVHLPARWPVR